MFQRLIIITTCCVVIGILSVSPARSADARLVIAIGGDLYLLDSDGTNPHPLLQDGCYNRAVQASPDGTLLAFQSRGCVESGFKLMNIATGDVTLYSDEYYGLLSPDWTRFAWIERRPGAKPGYTHQFFAVYVWDASMHGKGIVVGGGLYSYSTARWYLRWSPDSRYLMYATLDTQRGYALIVVDVTNGNKQVLDSESFKADSGIPPWLPNMRRLAVDYDVQNFVWSPNRQFIAIEGYNAYSEKRRISMLAVSLLDMATHDLRPLEPRDVNGFDPAWSPDGTRLVYVSNEFIQENPALFRWKLRVFEDGAVHTLFSTEDDKQVGDAGLASPVWLP